MLIFYENSHCSCDLNNKLCIRFESLNIVTVLILSRQFLIIFLVLLQFIAPLVHAHAGKQFSGFGVHLPGLERYDFDQPETILQTVNSGFDTEEAVIVGVNTGIELQYLILSGDTNDGHYLNQASPGGNSKTQTSFRSNFPPQSPPFVDRFFNPSHSPRAPPAH